MALSRISPFWLIKRAVYLCLVLLLCVSTFSIPPAMASRHASVEVSLPDHPIWLQGVLFNQINNRYPLIEYGQNIYFPLTWNLSRFMGLETVWSEENGLVIATRGRFAPLDPPDDHFNDTQATFRATRSTRPITINGRRVLPPHANLPWLLFRGVTYLPLTPAILEELHWRAHISPERGLSIEAGTSAESDLETIITMINNAANSRKLGFTAHLTMPQSEDSMTISGQIENSTIAPFGAVPGNYWWRKLSFDYAWQIALGEHRTSGITYFRWTGDMATGELDTGVSTDAPMRFWAPQIQEHPLYNLTDFAVHGRKRDSIARLEGLSPTRPDTSRYRIVFHGADERYAFRTIEVTVDWTHSWLREIIVRDRIFDPTEHFYGSGWYTLRLILHNRR